MKPDLPEKPPYQSIAKRKIIQKKELESRYYSDRVLAPLAAWVHGHRGAMAEVVRRMEAYFGRPVRRFQVQQYLALNPDKRVEPGFGYGLVLVRIVKTMRNEYKAGIAPAYTTGPIQVDPTSVKPDEDDLPPLEEENEPPQPEPAKKAVQFFVKRGKGKAR